MERKFILHSEYSPTGDQPEAINKLVEGITDGLRTQVLLGVTGSGKTFTMANVIERVNRPALVIAHNKTLAAQLCNEFREFFPNNRVPICAILIKHRFVSINKILIVGKTSVQSLVFKDK